MGRKIYLSFALVLLLSHGSGNSAPPSLGNGPIGLTGTLSRMIVGSGEITMDLDSRRLRAAGLKTDKSRDVSRFGVSPHSLLTILVLDDKLRAVQPGSIELTWINSGLLPEPLNASSHSLVLEKNPSADPVDLTIRDGRSGFTFFNIEGCLYDYDATEQLLRIKGGRILMSRQLATRLGRPEETGTNVGQMLVTAKMSAIEVTRIANGAAESSILPVRSGRADKVEDLAAGPDVIVGDVSGVFQFGSSGSQVGVAVGTTSCNNGNVALHWFQLPNTDHPVIPQSLYRMSGGPGNDERFEQIGHSWAKHAFFAFQDNACGFGCSPTDNTFLGPGCSDPYSASLNATQEGLGSRAWINPFTGSFPPTAAEHGSHTHSGVTHRVAVESTDLNTTLNPGAKYYAEAQYVTPHEYAWCQAHPGQCNMYNNASYRQFTVTGTTSFTFAAVGATVRMLPAINAWTGATINMIEPAAGADGRAFIAYKVTNPSAGVWHYEYVLLNQNLDRAIQSFSVPLGCGVAASNLGFHAPPNQPGIADDGTFQNLGFSNAPWNTNQTPGALTWSSETFAQNQNANAIRWGTMYNFRFDSNRPPQAMNATIGYFKTGSPTTVAIQGPAPDTCSPLAVTTAVSRKTHGGAGDFDIALPMTGEPGVECRNSGGDHTFIFTFTNPVVSGNAAVTSGTGAVAGSPSFSSNTMTVNLTGVTDVQRIIVTLSGVTDSSAQVLPDTAVSVNMLAADTTGNKSVGASDIAQTKAQSGASTFAGNFRTDVNANGNVSASDVAEAKANSGHTLP